MSYPLPIPAGFEGLPFVLDDVSGQTRTLNADGSPFDVAQLRPPSGETCYLGFAGAKDSNDGSTRESSVKTMARALALPNIGTVILGDTAHPSGVVYRNYSALDLDDGRSLSLIGEPSAGREYVTVACASATVWWLVAGTLATYAVARTKAVQVRDALLPDEQGDATRLTHADAYAGGELEPGHWATDGGTVWARAADSRSLVGDHSLRVLIDAPLWQFSGGGVLYLENLSLEGGDTPLKVRHATAYAKHCRFAYASEWAGLTAQGAVTILQVCLAAQNQRDGFNYHAYDGFSCQSVEIACVGRDNGWGGESQNNGTTSHDGGTLFGLSGLYVRNHGPNVALVNAGTTAWLIRCHAEASQVHDGSLQGCDYQSGDGASLWLDGCTWGGSDYGVVADYGNVYLRELLAS